MIFGIYFFSLHRKNHFEDGFLPFPPDDMFSSALFTFAK